MKVTAPWKRILAALAAGGIFVAGYGYAANLNQNLVINGDFEHVDLGTTNGSADNSPLILDWTPSVITNSAFAYSHNRSPSSYAYGAPPPNPGSWFFTPNRPVNTYGFIDQPGKLYQDINVSAGDTAGIIATGNAAFRISAYMGTYFSTTNGRTDRDVAHVHANFFNSSNVSLGTAVLSDSDAGDANVWSFNSFNGSIPVGTTRVQLSLYGTKVDGGGPDGYIDNVGFQVGYSALALVVDRNTGNATMKNLTGDPVNIQQYTVASTFEGLSNTNWLSIADHYDAGSPGPNQFDPDHNWSKHTSASDHGTIEEAEDTFQGASLNNNGTLNLGNAWIATPNEDLNFQYYSNGNLLTGTVLYTGNNGQPLLPGDFNADGSIDAADWGILRTHQLTDLSSLSLAQAYRFGDLNGDKLDNHADFVAFKTLYDAAHGAGSFLAMSEGVPEPTSLLLVCVGVAVGAPALRRRREN